MRYYLVSVQYNKEAEAENRTVPKAFDTLLEAEAAFYTQVGTDMKTTTLGGSVNMVFNSEGGIYPALNKKWGIMEKQEDETTTE